MSINNLKIKDYGRTSEEISESKVETMTTSEVQELYTVEAFAAPLVIVVRKSDGVRGTLEFVHSPRVYFGFKPE